MITALSFAQRIDNFKKLNPIISKTFSRYRKLMLKPIFQRTFAILLFCEKTPFCDIVLLLSSVKLSFFFIY